MTDATVGKALRTATDRLRVAGSESARLDAELLLGHVIGIDRSGVLAHPEARLGDGQRAAFEEAIRRRAAGEPVAYIRGIKEFYGLALTVDHRALIPRPETERLVDLAVDHVRGVLSGAPRTLGAPPLRIWDVGTGSGAIAVALVVTLRRRGYGDDVRVTASDRSDDALRLGLENAVAHGVADRIDFVSGDLTALADGPPATDLLLANLPYIPSADLAGLPVAASFEPPEALDGGPDGLTVIRRLLSELPKVVTPGGRALLEIGASQAEAAEEAAAVAVPGWRREVALDLGGRPRVLSVEPPPA